MRKIPPSAVFFYLSSLSVVVPRISSDFNSARDFCSTNPFLSEIALSKYVCVGAMAARRITRKILSKEVEEGVGAKVRRSVGSYEVRWQYLSR